jgi:hypothetical protein
MIAQDTVLVQLVRLVERIPTPPPLPRRSGRPIVYSDGLFLKALVIMIVRRIHRVGELLAVLEAQCCSPKAGCGTRRTGKPA